MKNKIISALAVCVLVCSITACSSSQDTTENTDEISTEDAATESPETVQTKDTSAKIYIGMAGETMKEYECESSDNLTPETLISTMASLTGWNLDLADAVTVGKDGMTVCFAKTSSLFVGPPEPQEEEFFVYDGDELTRTILDSIQYTLQYNFVDSELGDPSSLNIYYCMEGDQALELPLIGKTLPLDQPYQGLDDSTDASETEIVGVDEAQTNTLEGEFVGFVDDNTVEVKVEDGSISFKVEDEEVKSMLQNFEEGTLFMFESEMDGDIHTIVKVISE